MLIHNLSGREFWVRHGDRIAQLIVEKVMEVEVHQVDSLTETSRGTQGFGSTGLERPGGEDPFFGEVSSKFESWITRLSW